MPCHHAKANETKRIVLIGRDQEVIEQSVECNQANEWTHVSFWRAGELVRF